MICQRYGYSKQPTKTVSVVKEVPIVEYVNVPYQTTKYYMENETYYEERRESVLW